MVHRDRDPPTPPRCLRAGSRGDRPTPGRQKKAMRSRLHGVNRARSSWMLLRLRAGGPEVSPGRGVRARIIEKESYGQRQAIGPADRVRNRDAVPVIVNEITGSSLGLVAVSTNVVVPRGLDNGVDASPAKAPVATVNDVADH